MEIELMRKNSDNYDDDGQDVGYRTKHTIH